MGTADDNLRWQLASYGEQLAARYDAWFTSEPEIEATVDFLCDLAGEGPVLELGIGTGRIAVPLASRGVAVEGIDISGAMVARLRSKHGAERIRVVVGDFVDSLPEGPFSLALAVFDTLFTLDSQDELVRCLARVAERLKPGGAFVIEASVVPPGRFESGSNMRVTFLAQHEVRMEVASHDPMSQRVRFQHLIFSDDGVRSFPARVRYARPSELDLIAALAGLTMESRFGGWQREAFMGEAFMGAGRHVTVYRK